MATPLATLERLRRMETDQARRDLAARVTAEREAALRLEAAQAALTAEAAAAPTDAANPLAGAYALWLPAAQAGRMAAAAAVRVAMREVETARATLAEARAAARAVEIVAEERATAKRHERLRIEQAASDDLVSGRRN